MKAKVISVEEKFEKIVKYEHKCSELQKVKKEAELRDKKITVISEGLKELKAVHKKDIEDLTQKHRERMEKLKTVFEERVREASK